MRGGSRWPGARLEALYPLSIIADGSWLNVTVMGYAEMVAVALCREPEPEKAET